MALVHPGEVLREEMDERNLSANALARALRVPPGRVTAILDGERGISEDTARRLSQTMGTSSEFWLNLQTTWDLRRVLEGRPVDLHAGPDGAEPHDPDGSKPT